MKSKHSHPYLLELLNEFSVSLTPSELFFFLLLVDILQLMVDNNDEKWL